MYVLVKAKYVIFSVNVKNKYKLKYTTCISGQTPDVLSSRLRQTTNYSQTHRHTGLSPKSSIRGRY